MADYFMTIEPAIDPKDRFKISDFLETLGYTVDGTGQMTDFSECDISFSKKTSKKEN